MKKTYLLLLLFITAFSFAQTETINSKLIVNGNTSINTDNTTTANLFVKADGIVGSILTVETSTGIQGFKIGANGVPWSGGIIQDVNDTNTVFGLNAGANEVFTTGYFGFGKFNTFYGYNSGWLNKTGIQNNYFGSNSGFRNVTGSRNTMFGNGTVGPADGAGDDNLGFGEQAGQPILSGNRNMLMGNRILGFSNPLDNVSDAIAIGHYINLLGDTGTGGNTSVNEIVIGTNAVGNGSNTFTLGNNSIIDTYLKGNTHADSYIANGKTSDDILLGDGTTTTLSGLDGKFVDGTDPLDAVYNVSDGNVGVGLDVPTAKLHVKTDLLTDDILILENSTGDERFKTDVDGVTNITGDGGSILNVNQTAPGLNNVVQTWQKNGFQVAYMDSEGDLFFSNSFASLQTGIVQVRRPQYNATNPHFSHNTGGGFNILNGSFYWSNGANHVSEMKSDGSLGLGTQSGNNIVPSTLEATAMFHVKSTTKGSIAFPRMTQAQRLAITTPATGLHAYQTDSAENVYVNKSTGWEKYVTIKEYTVATLPTGTTGSIAYVTDASAVTYRATATGGGSDTVLVFFDGTNWIYH